MARRRQPNQLLRTTAPQHITWRSLRTYRTRYRSKRGDEITIRSVTKPPKTKVLRGASGRRKYYRINTQTAVREVIIVAKTKNRKKPVDQEELEELEALEELEELDEDEEEDEDVEVEEDDDEDEDEEEEPDDEDEDEDEDDEDDEDEEPAPKRATKSKKSKSAKKGQSRAAAEGKVGTQEVAAHFGIDGRALRILLRKHNVPTDPDSGRYQWSSLKNKEVIRIGKLIASGEHKRAQREQLDKAKATSKKGKAKKPSAKGTTKGTTKSTKSRKRSRSDEDDE